jgi:enamine deaminase RidA (YjgF/YER057c/UK114 family)
VRAFIAGKTEGAQALDLVAKTFAKKKLPIPVISIIRVGALENPASQVVLETIAEAPTVQNPNGIVFVSGQLTSAPKAPNPAAAPLAEKSLANLRAALAGMQVEPPAVLRVTCFASTLADQAQVRSMMRAQFDKAALNLVQIQKDADNQEVECEAVARLSKAPPGPVQLVNPTNAAFAQAVLLNAPQVIFTSTHSGPAGDDGMRATFRALGTTLQAAGASMDTVFYSYAYPINAATLQSYRNVRFEFFKRERAPASTNLVFEGVMSPTDAVGIDVIALPR